MQKVYRGGAVLVSIHISELTMSASILLRYHHSPSAATSVPSYGIAQSPSFNCRCGLEDGHVHFMRRPSYPLLQQGRLPSPGWLLNGNRGRGFRASQGLRTRGNGLSTDGLEKGGEMVEESGGEENILSGASEGKDRDCQLQRRQRSGSSSGVHADLLTIPGVGPRNLRKLVDKGFRGVAQLKQLYREKFYGESSQKMAQFLQSSVGIIHKNHAESIASFIKENVEDEIKKVGSVSDVKLVQKKRLTFCVEGNISVGKTTFLHRIANETLELRDLVEIVPEPISKWQDVGPEHFNILDAFYAEPKRYAYTFQNYVFVTRLMQERESACGIKPLRLMERSVFSDRMVFVRAVHEANWMNEMELSIYDSWFDPVVSCLPGLVPDGFIYLRASPDTCHRRMMLRNREEEGGVTLDYLRDLHEKHESWLLPLEGGNHGVLSISQLPFRVDNSLHSDIKDRVFYLKGNHMHSSIQKVPALVLDCEPNIDFTKDTEAKRQYARQVAEFFAFVQRKKEENPEKVTDAKCSSHQLLLPHEGGLWVPQGRPVTDSVLKSLHFRNAISPFVPPG